ncbi:hypothetical protein BC829DRAFT_408629 [Chytridium lagenaria]|nr:hypothetical protein BC829DRAFT_408629 [Chytridium lagenaria]
MTLNWSATDRLESLVRHSDKLVLGHFKAFGDGSRQIIQHISTAFSFRQPQKTIYLPHRHSLSSIMSALPHLASELKVGSLTLKNRYRSTAGLIITEGIFIEPMGSEWPYAPGIWSKAQVAGWKKIVNTVHAEKSAAGQPTWVPPPSPQTAESSVSSPENPATFNPSPSRTPKRPDSTVLNSTPPTGYLPHQFLEAHSNKRTDAYGGSPENRARFILDIVKIFVEVMGDSTKVAIKLSPCGGYNDMGDPIDVLRAEYSYLIKELDNLKLGYIGIVRFTPDFDPTGRGTKVDVIEEFGGLIKNANGSEAEGLIDPTKNKRAIDLACFGRPYLGEFTLPGGTPGHPDYTKLYTQGDDGYIDY